VRVCMYGSLWGVERKLQGLAGCGVTRVASCRA